MSVEEKFAQLKAIIALTDDDLKKFTYKGNKNAGIRVRKNLQDVKDIAADIRKDILDARK